MSRGDSWSDAQIDSACRMLREGGSFSHVADQLGVTRGSVSGTIHRLRRAGDPRVPASSSRDDRRSNRMRQMDALAELMAEGTPTLAAAARDMRIEPYVAYDLWQSIMAGLGPQALA